MPKQKVLKIRVVFITLLFILLAVASTVFANRTKSRDSYTISNVKTIQAALELFKDECGGYPIAPILTDTNTLQLETYSDGCPVGITFGTFIGTMPKNTVHNFKKPEGFWSRVLYWFGVRESERADVPFSYCSTATSTSLECVSSRKGYLIPFVLEKQTGYLKQGNHFATPQGIQ